MPLVNSPIPNLINGVSQQAAAVRLPTQCEIQTNAYPSLVEGLRRSPPSEYVAKLTASTVTHAFLHTIERGDGVEQYAAIFTNGDVDAYKISDGSAMTVSFPNGTGYLATSTPETDIKCVTVADYTFVVNRAITPAMKVTTSSTNGNEVLFFVKQAVNGLDYKILIDTDNNGSYDVTYTHTTHATNPVSTSAIADALKTGIATALGAGWTVTRENYVVRVVRSSASAFRASVEDARGGDALKMVKNSVQRFTDLPVVAPANYIVEVKGDNTNNFDNYYVKFQCDDTNVTFGVGSWVETVAPGIAYQLDPATMPHALRRTGASTMSFEQLTWGDRVAGDATTAPNPSFVGSSINDVFFFKNRLGFLTDENVVLSQAGEFYNFFRQTAQTVLDDDVIDVAGTHSKVSFLWHAVPYNEKLYLFSDKTQFVLEGTDILSAKTVSINQTTEYNCSRYCKPVALGESLFFLADNGNWSVMWEYLVSSDTSLRDAAEVTAHVPNYIPSGITKQAVCATENLIVEFSPTDPNHLYIYKFYWQGDQKVQSAWGKIELNSSNTILNLDFIGSILYLVVQRSDGIFLEKMNFAPAVTDPDLEYVTHLNHRLTEAQLVSRTYNSGTNQTTFTLPFTKVGTPRIVTRYTSGGLANGIIVPVVSSTSTTLVVSGDYRTTNVYIGTPYTRQYRFSTLYQRTPTSAGNNIVETSGRLQVRYIELLFNNAGYFEVKVTPQFGTTSTYKYSGFSMGTVAWTLGEVALSSGTFQIPILSKNDEFTLDIIDDSHLPANFTSAEWTGYFVSQSSRV